MTGGLLELGPVAPCTITRSASASISIAKGFWRETGASELAWSLQGVVGRRDLRRLTSAREDRSAGLHAGRVGEPRVRARDGPMTEGLDESLRRVNLLRIFKRFIALFRILVYFVYLFIIFRLILL